MRTVFIVPCGCCLLLAGTVGFGATTITLQDGMVPLPGRPVYWGTTDAWLNYNTTGNYGASTSLRIQWYDGRDDTAVIRFDLAGQIPPYQRILSAKLWLYYRSAVMTNDEAIEIKPYRIDPTKPWFENIYDGTTGHGVNCRWRDDAQTQPWTGQDCAWWDKIDDGNSTRWVQDENGMVGPPYNPVKPPATIDFTVTPSVKAWYEQGQTNTGFCLFAVNYVGGAHQAYGLFASRNDGTAGLRPKLVIAYEGALAPLAEAGGPYAVNRGGSVDLNGAGSYDPDGGGITAWRWDLDNDGPYDDADGATPTVTYLYLVNTLGLKPGNRSIRLQVTDEEGETGVDTATLQIPPAAPGDFDADGDVDLADFGFFQRCFGGPNRPISEPDCRAADLDRDADVDLSDFAMFQTCFNGPNRLPAAGCP